MIVCMSLLAAQPFVSNSVFIGEKVSESVSQSVSQVVSEWVRKQNNK